MSEIFKTNSVTGDLSREVVNPGAFRPLATGTYIPTESFKSIKAMVAVCFKGDGTLVAVTGPALDMESIRYAALFAAAPDMKQALEGMLFDYESQYGGGFCECDQSVDLTCNACRARAALSKAEVR